MFDKYMICENDFCNVKTNSKVTGFQIGARLPYYRGLGISMVEDVTVTVDGKKYPRDVVRVTLRERTYTLDEMAQDLEECWEFGEVATVTVLADGGLSAGKHHIELAETIRVSYRPGGGSTTFDSKDLALAD